MELLGVSYPPTVLAYLQVGGSLRHADVPVRTQRAGKI